MPPPKVCCPGWITQSTPIATPLTVVPAQIDSTQPGTEVFLSRSVRSRKPVERLNL